MTEASSITAPAAAVPRKSRRPWFLIGCFLFLLAATPVSYRFFMGWLIDRELEAIQQELDADDPHWRWGDIAAQMPAPPPDDRNAALQLVKVADLLSATPFKPARLKKTTIAHVNARLSIEEAKSLRGTFANLGPDVVAEARKLSELPEGRFPLKSLEDAEAPGSGIDAGIVGVMNLLKDDAVLRAHDGKTEEAAESCQALLNAVHAINDYPTFMAYLIRGAGRDFALEAVERTLANGTVSEERLQALQAALAREAGAKALYHATRGERAYVHEIFTLVKQGKLDEEKVGGPISGTNWLPTRWEELIPHRLTRNHAQILRLQSELVQASKLRDEAQMEEFRKLEQKSRNAAEEVKFVVMFAIKSAKDEQAMQARLRCAITAIAAERFRLKRGGWPRAPDELVKTGFLAELLKDLYDGNPLRWRRTNTGVLVYSVGSDKLDNGGKLNRGAPGQAGADVGFELWSPEWRGVPAPANGEK